MKGYIRRPSASDIWPVIEVPYTAAELLKMGFIPIITANSTEVLFRRP